MTRLPGHDVLNSVELVSFFWLCTSPLYIFALVELYSRSDYHFVVFIFRYVVSVSAIRVCTVYCTVVATDHSRLKSHVLR